MVAVIPDHVDGGLDLLLSLGRWSADWIRASSVPQGDRVPDPRQRRRVQRRGQPVRLLRPADRHRDGDGRLSHPGELVAERVRATGVRPFLPPLRARRSARAEHRHRLQRPRSRRAAPVVFYNRAERGGGATEAGRFRLEGDLRGRRALVPQRRHFRLALGDDRGSDRRGDDCGQGRRRDRLVRSQLPGQAVGDPGRPGAGQSGAPSDRRAGRRPGRQRGGPPGRAGYPGPRADRPIEPRPELVPRDDRRRSGALSADQDRGHHPARGPFDQPPRLERGGLGRRAGPRGARMRTRCARPESAAATASPRDSSTACSPASRREAIKLGWAHGALLTTFPGDTTMATLEQVRSLAAGGSARIQR